METKNLTLDEILKAIFHCPLNHHQYYVEILSSMDKRNDYLIHVKQGDDYVFCFTLPDLNAYLSFHPSLDLDTYVYLNIKQYEEFKDLPY